MRLEQREAGCDVGQHIKSWRSLRKLSQMELAGMANISARHLSFIETGRGKASPATLLSLASTLQIPLLEQNRLLLAAGFAPRYEEAPISDEKMAHIRSVVELILESHQPFPAYAVNRVWDIVAANDAHHALVALMISDSNRREIGDNNILRLLFHPKGLRNHIVNWLQLSQYVMQALRTQSLMYPTDEELITLSAEITKWTDTGEDASNAESSMSPSFAVPMTIRIKDREISLVTTMLKFAAPLSATVEGLTIESFYPADEKSKDAFCSMI